MSCWCGHGPWHHYGYPYPPAAAYPPLYPPVAYAPAPPRRGRRPRAEDVEAYLGDLEDELARVREELASYRRGRAASRADRRRHGTSSATR